jgi:hypothetical protein
MTNKTLRTYWYLSNSPGYEIGIASNPDYGQQYAHLGFERMTRDKVMRRMLKGPANRVTIDHVPFQGDQIVFAKALRHKKALDIAA